MTRLTMRTVLRRRLNEVSPDNWTNGDLDDVLNLGLHKVQTRIMALDPEAFLYIARAPITANEEFVAKPQGFWYEKAVRLLDNTTHLYDDIDPLPYDQARDLSTDSEAVYSHFGRHFAIHPVPAASVANGIEILYVPVLSMAADTDVPDVNIGLHDAIIKAGQLTLMPETGEPYKDLKQSLEDDLADIPLYYRITAGEAPKLRPDIESLKGY